MNIQISKKNLLSLDLVGAEVVESIFYSLAPGVSEYRLYSFLSMLLDSAQIVDIGTYKGCSAMALSTNKTNKVITYDLVDHFRDVNHKIYSSGIEFRLGNFMTTIKEVCKSKLILIDVSPHNGADERFFMQEILKNSFVGWLLFDDIHLNQNMQDFWEEIKLPKFDLTAVGHVSGTGLVDVGTGTIFEVVS